MAVTPDVDSGASGSCASKTRGGELRVGEEIQRSGKAHWKW